jgi:hypothetical protein
VHFYGFGIAPEPAGLFAGGLSSGHYVFNPHDNYQLVFTTSTATTETMQLNVWSLNYIIVRISNGQVYRVTK